MNNQDVDDIKFILKEQLDSINRLGKFRLPPKLEGYEQLRTIYEDILECNKVMMEIINESVGGIEKLVGKTNDWNYTKPIIGLDENGQPVTIDSWGISE